METEITIRVDRPANGGQGVGRDDDGRAVFCEGALAGETVRVSLIQEKKRFARGVVTEVLEASPDRVEPSCATHSDGCGGCDMAHANAQAQRAVKTYVVTDALSRIGKFDDETIDSTWLGFTEDSNSGWYRTTARLGIAGGQLGYRKARSHSIIQPSECGVVHPRIEDVIRNARFPKTAGPEVVVRTSVSTGQVIVILDGSADGVQVPDGVELVTRDELAAGTEVAMAEEAGGRSWQVSASSFFQAGPGVATALVDAVQACVGDLAGKHLVDAYCGVGLFAGTVGQGASAVTAIEQSSSSVRDCHDNLEQQRVDGQRVEIIESAVESWTATPADVVVADPARSGLERDGVTALIRTNAERFILVSCDSGSFGRDAGLLRDAGYTLESVRLVDAFRDTSHVEIVAAFTS